MLLKTANAQVKVINGNVGINLPSDPTHLFEVNGGNGGGNSVPIFKISSSSTVLQGTNGVLTLFNTDNTTNNYLRLSFQTNNSTGYPDDFLTLGSQFKNRTAGNISADFMISTADRGNYSEKVRIQADGTINFTLPGTYNIPSNHTYITMDNEDTYYNASPTIRPNTTNVGYLGTPSYRWQYVYASTFYKWVSGTTYNSLVSKKSTSDTDLPKHENSENKLSQLKTDFMFIEPANELSYDSIGNLVSDSYKSTKEMGKRLELNGTEMLKLFPELTEYNSSTDNYFIDYLGLIPYLVESIKHQTIHIDSLKEVVFYLQSELSSLKQNGFDTEAYNSEARLIQNTPNPFYVSTQIGYYLPSSINNASLYLYNLNGIQLKSYAIKQSGHGYITINGSELKAGMYIYTLIADNKEVGTKRMILTE